MSGGMIRTTQTCALFPVEKRRARVAKLSGGASDPKLADSPPVKSESHDVTKSLDAEKTSCPKNLSGCYHRL